MESVIFAMAKNSIQSKGGIARAESLTAEQRADIARTAAVARSNAEQKILTATHMGPLKIGGVEIQSGCCSTVFRVASGVASSPSGIERVRDGPSKVIEPTR
jgi:hypothetical protein